MNTRRAINDSGSPVALSVSFNQDKSCFAVGLDTGFCIFTTDPCELSDARDFNGGIGAVEMMGKTNFLAIVGGGRKPKFPQNKVIIWDDAKKAVALTLEFGSLVHGVRLSRTTIVAILHNSVSIYAFSSPPKKRSEYETADNPLGLCCLGEKILVFPGRTPGQVQLMELETGNISIIPAHTSALRAIELSPDGEVLATASETGTLVRVFSATNCSKIAELRRGVDPASIFSLSISPSSTLLAVTSDKSTLHIFELPHPYKAAKGQFTYRPQNGGTSAADEGPTNKWGMLGKIPLLPRVFSDVYSIASVRFEIGEEPVPGLIGAASNPAPGKRPPKGVAGWVNDEMVVVLGAGKDARWEKFGLYQDEQGKTFCIREGWRRYLGASSSVSSR